VSESAACEELLVRQAIADVLSRYVRGVDRNDTALIRSCYHEGAIDDHGMFVGPADAFADWVTGERSARHAGSTHFLAPPYVVVHGDSATVETYCMAHHVSHPGEDETQRYTVLAVRYLDRFERREGRWLIAHRRCVFDWSYSSAADAEAMRLPEGVTPGRRDQSDASYSLQ
jgi:hypothetical protein